MNPPDQGEGFRKAAATPNRLLNSSRQPRGVTFGKGPPEQISNQNPSQIFAPAGSFETRGPLPIKRNAKLGGPLPIIGNGLVATPILHQGLPLHKLRAPMSMVEAGLDRRRVQNDAPSECFDIGSPPFPGVQNLHDSPGSFLHPARPLCGHDFPSEPDPLNRATP